MRIGLLLPVLIMLCLMMDWNPWPRYESGESKWFYKPSYVDLKGFTWYKRNWFGECFYYAVHQVFDKIAGYVERVA